MYYIIEDRDGVFITNTLKDSDFVHSEHDTLRDAEIALSRFDFDSKNASDELIADCDKDDF